MESWSWIATDGGLGFGFDDINFSDRVLCLHIVSALPSDTNSEFDGTDFKLRKLHINSLVLASKSQFFFKLFKNGMKETQQRDEVNLKINTSEESALLDVLKFMYGLSMSATSAPDLVNVLMAADKFEVPSCVKQCVDLLLKLPMSIESALLYIGLPLSVSEGELVQPLFDTMKKYLADRYRNFTKSEEELLGLPLSAIEIVLALDGLRVDSEDEVLDFILKWARPNYPKLEERREILSKHLIRFVYFSCVSSLKIKEVLSCSEFDYEELSKLVIEALLSKDQELAISTEHDNPRRVHKLLPIKVIQLDMDQPRCVVYLDIKKQQCADLYVSQILYSRQFRVAGRVFSLLAQCLQKNHRFGLFVEMTETGEACTIAFEFAAMNKASREFVSRATYKNCQVIKNEGKGCSDLFKTSWEEFMSEEGEYFIDGTLHLRADITIVK